MNLIDSPFFEIYRLQVHYFKEDKTTFENNLFWKFFKFHEAKSKYCVYLLTKTITTKTCPTIKCPLLGLYLKNAKYVLMFETVIYWIYISWRLNKHLKANEFIKITLCYLGLDFKKIYLCFTIFYYCYSKLFLLYLRIYF